MGRLSREERLRQIAEHKAQAIKHKEEHRLPPNERPAVTADAFQLGEAYGIGVGLYFKTLSWLRLLFIWLALGSVPFLVLINSSKFTSPRLAFGESFLGSSLETAINDLNSTTAPSSVDYATGYYAASPSPDPWSGGSSSTTTTTTTPDYSTAGRLPPASPPLAKNAYNAEFSSRGPNYFRTAPSGQQPQRAASGGTANVAAGNATREAAASDPVWGDLDTALILGSDYDTGAQEVQLSWDSPEAGVQVYPNLTLSSFTFAAIMDNRGESAVLSWMNVKLPGMKSIGGLYADDFLMWISIADAITIGVFIVFCTLLRHWARRFARDIDAHTVEVADYTVVVKGLPEVDPVEVGRHFSRFGHVMDVVLVKDFGTLLRLAGKATALEQQRAAAGEMYGRHFARAYAKRVAKAEGRLKAFMAEAESVIDRAGCPTKAIFVTFRTQAERAACEAACPKNWLASWFQHHEARFARTHAFWVEQAKPPEDYIYENLSYDRAARFARVLVSRLVVVAILLACALGVTKLMKMSRDLQTTVIWRNALLDSQVAAAMAPAPAARLANLSAAVTARAGPSLAAAASRVARKTAGMVAESSARNDTGSGYNATDIAGVLTGLNGGQWSDASFADGSVSGAGQFCGDTLQAACSAGWSK